MAYELVVLSSGALHKSADDLVPEVTTAIAADGRWARFFEVRMAAGPTVNIEPEPGKPGRYRVAVDWGTQHATTQAGSLTASIEAADKLAGTFYDIRNQLAGGSP